MKDIEISRKANIKNISEIAENLNIDSEYIEQYGKYKAKISNKIMSKLNNKPNGKLVLMTSINPTPLGEGKTTMAIGLADGLRQIGEKSILALREPSQGPVFGIKGGATGGGYSQVVPMDEINLHFTGDIHAITAANNLLAAMIDNHIYFGNKLKIKNVVWKRCVDLNDRSLRKVEINLNQEKNMIPREDGFDISVASEIMAIFCLAEDLNDLQKRLGNIIIGYNDKEEPIRARDLKAEGAMTALLKDALNPNLVQTLENTPAIIHGGPFANIAHGCNSVVATKMALKLSDYVITEAGFGADLGAEKFFNIKCRTSGINPNLAVCVATIKALKYHGGATKESLEEENIEALKRGIPNLLKHIDNIKNKFNVPVIVGINKYNQDTELEIETLKTALDEVGVELSLIESWEKGGKGAIDLAQKVVKLSNNNNKLKFVYNIEDGIKEKIDKIAKEIYGASGVEYSEESIKTIEKIEKMGYGNLPICIAKTQYSLSDDPKKLEINEEFKITIRDINLRAGAGFIVALAGKIYTMPGLPEKPAAENIGVDELGNIYGIF
ncbi:MAG: formate--tetrahydrofolate ligase [Clostridia bacterium]|nr:formate--tetrahydrofolate ligase [Clostridia bacterium]